MTKYGDTEIGTFKNNRIDVFNINPDSIDIEDIAHALSMCARFNGHLKRFLSVAEHSVSVAFTVSPRYRLEGLMHDAAEAYISDVPRPIKKMIPAIKEIDHNLTEAIFRKYNLVFPIPEEVHLVDREMCMSEASASGMPVEDWGETTPIVEYEPFWWAPDRAKKEFLTTFEYLSNLRTRRIE